MPGILQHDAGYTWPDIPDRIYDSLTASATITAGQVVEVTGSATVGPAGAASTAVCGIAVAGAASGAPVRVFMPGGAWTSTASGGITAGARVSAGAAGTVQTIGAGAFATMIGTALTTATNGNPVSWTLV